LVNFESLKIMAKCYECASKNKIQRSLVGVEVRWLLLLFFIFFWTFSVEGKEIVIFGTSAVLGFGCFETFRERAIIGAAN